MASSATMDCLPVEMDRRTKGGRDLRYRLTVLQQPERARACGSGSKSAADRRPVDPPPVVELRIFDMSAPSHENNDITFNYNANFFLFATLEQARPMAHGRVQTPAATTPPVLTGMPVSGMAYLDRPAEAGYFLFPDLSVRHEGRYRLTFNLYEETKEEKDFDENAEACTDAGSASFDWRMEAKSLPFSVYSAKKFPGLTESTALSRTVAEQGCRVRIRRDVRMRRRDGKHGGGGGDYDRAEDEFARRTARTPERQPHDQYRARSLSAASDHSRLGQDPQRRPSIHESGPPPPPPPAPYSQPGPASHLDFGHQQPTATTQYPSQYPPPPTPPASQAPPMSPATGYQTPFQTPHNLPYSYSRPPSQSYNMTPSAVPTSIDRRRSSTSYPPPSPQYPATSEVEVKKEARLSLTSLPSPIRPTHKLEPLQLPSTQSPMSGTTLPPIQGLLRASGADTASSLPSPIAGIGLGPYPTPIIEADTQPPLKVEERVQAGSKRQREDPPFETHRPLFNGERLGDSSNSSRGPYHSFMLPNQRLMEWTSASGSRRRHTENEYIG